MCIVRFSHLLRDGDDIRITLATEPFADTGDFTDPMNERDCACGEDAAPVRNQLETYYLGERADNLPLACQVHNCCILIKTVTPCKWVMYMRKKYKYGLRDEIDDNLETRCPNVMVLHTYFPVIDGVPRPDPHPVFPIEGVIWSDWPFETVADHNTDPVEGEVQSQALHNLMDAQVEVAVVANELFDFKKHMREAIAKARQYIDDLEADLNNNVQINVKSVDRDMHGYIRILYNFEYSIADKYERFLRELRYCLRAIGKYPEEDSIEELLEKQAKFTSPDGSFSVSYKLLELAGSGPQAILEACDGPLKVCSRFEDRYNELRRRMRKRKRSSVDDASSKGEVTLDDSSDEEMAMV